MLIYMIWGTDVLIYLLIDLTTSILNNEYLQKIVRQLWNYDANIYGCLYFFLFFF